MIKDQHLPEIHTAGCKVNLWLKITGRREDGYHLLDSIFWPLAEPQDILEFSSTTSASCEHASNALPLDEKFFTVSCDTKGIDLENNTLTKAYAAFVRHGGKLQTSIAQVHVHLRKGIPHGAGLGGGSSDAATVLRWCNAHAQQPLNDEALQAAALQVGADVPFFLHNVPARVQGIGEILTPLRDEEKKCLQGYVVLLCPDIMISTPWAYSAWDKKKYDFFSKKLLTKIGHGDRYVFACAGEENATLENDFEEVVFEEYPELAKLKKSLLTQGAKLATMSGSGSSIIGIVDSKEAAEKVAQHFQHAQCKVFITTL